MPVLTISKKKSAELIAQLNYMFSRCKVDSIDRTAAAELAFAEMISATLPSCGAEQSVAEFYRSTLLDGVKDFLDQLVEVVQINQEQCLLAVWGAYDYRMSIVIPKRLSDCRPCIGRYLEKVPARHAEMIAKYPELGECYYGIGSVIYV